jgi:hypothetical protein
MGFCTARFHAVGQKQNFDDAHHAFLSFFLVCAVFAR